jgi:hypothetical protein
MRYTRLLRHAVVLLSGAGLLLQAGCTATPLFDFLSTVFLGITAAGSLTFMSYL